MTPIIGKRNLGGSGGFTLIELLIGLIIASVIVYSAFSLYLTMHKEMLVQDVVSDTQANARAATEALSYMISMAGYNIPKNMDPIETTNSNPDTILVNFDSSVLQGVKLEAGMYYGTDNLVCTGHDLQGLAPGEWAYISDPTATTGEFFSVSAIDESTSVIYHDTTPLSSLYPAGSRILKINRVRFYVDRSDTTQPKLMVQNFGSSPQIFADNIYDLDFRYYMENGSIVSVTPNPWKIRMVEIDVTGRSYRGDILPNGYCTRNFTLKVGVRNLEMGT